jgi:hypothetical protein
MQKEIFEIQFDPTSFNSNIDKALASLSRLETQSGESALAVRTLAGSVGGVSFSRPVGEILRLNTALSQVNVSTLKLDNSQEGLARATRLTEVAMRNYGKTTQDTTDKIQKQDKATQSAIKSTFTFGERIRFAFNNLAGALGITAGIAGIVSLGRAILNTSAEFEKYRAVLTNTLGSTALANNALATITDFASKTPFSVAQLTESFVKLANQGFVPSINELRKLGDLASSTGKDFDMLAEAILDAQTGEFERLKEFGIKGKVEGDKVTFAFKGVRTEIDNNAESIRKYIVGLGDMKGVQGAMEAISQTLTGQVSNLGDAWDQMLVALGNNTRGIFTTLIEYSGIVLNKITEINNEMNALSKVDPNAGGFMSMFSAWDRVAGRSIVKNRKALQEITSDIIANAKTQDDIEKGKDRLRVVYDEKRAQTDKLYKAKSSASLNEFRSRDYKGLRQAYNEQILALDAQAKLIADKNKKSSEGISKAKQKELDALMKLEEAYWKKLRDMRSSLATYKFQTSPKSAESIQAEYARLLEIEKTEIQKQFSKLGKLKVLTMQAEAVKMSKARSQTDIDEFNKAQADALNGINRAIEDQEFSIREKKIALMKEGFVKDNEATQLEYDKQINAIERAGEDRLKAIEEQRKSGLLTDFKAGQERIRVEKETQANIELVEQDSYEKRLKNLQKFYEDMLGITDAESAKRVAKDAEAIAQTVLKESERYAKGEITYEEYERSIARKQSSFRKTELDTQLTNQEQSLMLLQESLKVADDATKTAIETKIALAKEGIAKTQTEINTANKEFTSPIDSLIGKAFGIDPNDPESTKDIEKFKGAVTSAISETAKAVNQSLQAQIDADNRAIESQKRRVDEASRIASEGNAEYLQQEEERMRELEAKRDEDARKQLAINAALQASQVLVSITGALASSGGEPIQVATKVATIIAALATGFALVSSLQSKTPSFFEGTDFVPLGNNKKGRDTVPAFLHEGEAVIQADKNKAYAPAIKAIRRGLIDPEILNGFVTGSKMNHFALGQALQTSSNPSFKETHFIEMNERLAGLEQVMLGTTKAVKQIGVNVNLDSDGFSLSIQKHLDRKSKIWNA